MPETNKLQRHKQENFLFILMGIILLGLLVSGYFLFVGKILPGISNTKTKATNNIPSETGKPETPNYGNPSENDSSGQAMNLYFAAKGKEKLVKEMRRIPQGEKTIITLGISLIHELIRGPFSPNIRPVIPQGTQLRALFFHKGVFFVDFSKELIENHPGGAQEEVMTIFSIVNTLTELDAKAKVRFLVNGSEVDTLRGHVGLKQPLTRLDELL